MKKLLICLLIGLASCTHAPETQEPIKLPPAPQKQMGEISLMSFNVENLFDTEHDPGKEDFTFLPLAMKNTKEVKEVCTKMGNRFYRDECLNMDWNNELLVKKLNNLQQTLLQVDGGKGADILVLVEVENDRILTKLNKEYLGVAQYKTQVLIEGQDPRGIDVAILSRFPTDGVPTLHKIPFKSMTEKDNGKEKILRGILEVTLVLPDKSKLTVFANHFPSQQNPPYWRTQYVEHLFTLMQERSKKNSVIAAGDLNITGEEEAAQGYFGQTFSQIGIVPHLQGCAGCPPGSHNYRGSWSFLDALVISKDLGPTGKAKWKVVPDSFQVPRSAAIHIQGDGMPLRFDEETGKGVSDHLPLYVRLAPRK